MSKIISLIITTLVFLFNAQLSYAATLGLSPSTGVYNKGCIMGLKIDLDTQGAQTDGTDVILIYDPTKLTLSTSNIINGTIYQDYPGNSVDQTAGKVSISGISSVSTPFTGKGTFATVNFTVNPQAQGAIQVRFDFDPNDKTKTTDSNVVERGTITDLLSTVTDGNFTAGTGSGCGASGQGQVGQLPGGQGQQLSSSDSASPLPTKTVLPDTGLSGPTMIITAAGMILTILGIAGLALL